MIKMIIWVALLVAVLVLLGVFAGPQVLSRLNKNSSDAIRMGEAPKPAFTSAMQEKLSKSNGFQVLVSFTGAGFEPSVVNVSAGDTVRFTNNSTGALSLQIDGTAMNIASRDFFEYTFSAPGEYAYASGEYKGNVLVR